MIITLLLLMILNFLEALYLAIKYWGLKKKNAPDIEYTKMTNKVAPLMYVTLAISVSFLFIVWIFG